MRGKTRASMSFTVKFYVYCCCNIFVYLAGYSRGGYSQNRWGSSYRDGGSDARAGYSRSQPSGGSYNRPAPYTKGAYSQVINMSYHVYSLRKNKQI